MKTSKTILLTTVICLFAGIQVFSQSGDKKKRPTPEQLLTRLDANKDGSIVKDEVKNERFLKRFDKIDTNADGAITLEELKVSFEKRKGNRKGKGVGKNNDKQTPEMMFAKLDVNNDGRIDKDELITNERQSTNQRFEKMDVNSDGVISLEEFKKGFQKKRR